MKHIKEYNEYIDPFKEDDWDEVEPDGTFLTWLKIKYPDESKWKDITEIYCYSQKLTDLIGIEKLINLEKLSCGYNQLTELDVSNNIRLIYLLCGYNQLTKLNLSKNINLEELYCNHNQLLELDLSKNIELGYLSCYNNQLRELNVTKNIKLNYLYCHNNKLTELDITKNIKLRKSSFRGKHNKK